MPDLSSQTKSPDDAFFQEAGDYQAKVLELYRLTPISTKSTIIETNPYFTMSVEKLRSDIWDDKITQDNG
ncbi:hypothetical protein Clacol_009571 [Clathrus columnatus]|uniref:Uncharacterized protein n=1 Tax=Clathrus columnatus TaxID=1419009 RepID=A0AAV5ATR7_9AGAM|nr:hypothetical protein Clacol_009571 [Clathrus columnatus]